MYFVTIVRDKNTINSIILRDLGEGFKDVELWFYKDSLGESLYSDIKSRISNGAQGYVLFINNNE